jgi:hypothetical protein
MSSVDKIILTNLIDTIVDLGASPKFSACQGLFRVCSLLTLRLSYCLGANVSSPVGLSKSSMKGELCVGDSAYLLSKLALYYMMAKLDS